MARRYRRRRRKPEALDGVIAIGAVVGISYWLNPLFTYAFLALMLPVVCLAVFLAMKTKAGQNRGTAPRNQKGAASRNNNVSSINRALNASQRKGLEELFSRSFNQTPLENQPTPAPPQNWSLDLIKSLDWLVFEHLCAGYFRAKGYRAEVTDHGADGGVDVCLYNRRNPAELFAVIQCKAWASQSVGVQDIRALLGIMTHFECKMGIFITTSDYTVDASEFAKGKHIKLINGEGFLRMLTKLQADEQFSLLQKATKGDYTTPSCPSCAVKLVRRQPRAGTGSPFWGCVNFPRCRYTMHIGHTQANVQAEGDLAPQIVPLAR